jgi:uncharacterized protein (TIGR02679 family)
MSGGPDARLQRLLGGPHLAELRKRLRQSFARAPIDKPVDHIRIAGLSAEEHAALAALVGRPQRFTKSLSIDLRRVDDGLRRSGVATSLRDALEQLDGPILHTATSRLWLQTAWAGVIDGCTHPGLRGVLLTPDGMGLLKRLSRQDAEAAAVLCRRAEAVLRCLPAQGVARSQLAADVLGDPHALDTGRGTATLVLAAWRRTTLPVPDDGCDSDSANVVERTRDIWARAGVLVNELARPALFLNLPAETGSAGWRAGEPAYASLRSLLRAPPRWHVTERAVYVCENPNLLAIAADTLGAGCAPLVCTDGMPAAAQRCLLSQLTQAGARLCYHSDFDWPGLRIGNHVMHDHGAAPWRFRAADYLAGAAKAPRPSHTLVGKPVDAAWDAALTATMLEQGISIAEEAVAAMLLQDLNCK